MAFILNELQTKSSAKNVYVGNRYIFKPRIVSRELCTESHTYIIYESTPLIHYWIRKVLRAIEEYKKWYTFEDCGGLNNDPKLSIS